jgi:glyoxalase family protein
MSGIHHVTAIAGKPAVNLGFYTRTLGLRFVKRTVNFDDPGTYHFYYGDEAGSPGTILTFFPWEHAAPGNGGVGLAHTTAFRVPAASISFWRQRLLECGVGHKAPTESFGDTVLEFTDPDGMSLALTAVDGAETEPAWSSSAVGSHVPAEHAIRGFHGVSLMLDEVDPTGAVLTDVLGFSRTGRDGTLFRFRADSTVGGVVDIREAKGALPGRMGRGSVHHVAFRAADDAEQAAMARKLAESHGLRSTGRKDRQYFRSVYFREPGGVLFEIATDQPGFTVDEPLATLGSTLKLPRFLEPRRQQLEATLPPLEEVAA